MSTASAKQNLHNLLEQHKQYKEMLKQQEDELRRLQVQIAYTRTVVEMTLPGEVRRAHREYLSTIEYSSQHQDVAKQEYEGIDAMLTGIGPLDLGRLAGSDPSSSVLGRAWVQVTLFLISLLFARFISREASRSFLF